MVCEVARLSIAHPDEPHLRPDFTNDLKGRVITREDHHRTGSLQTQPERPCRC